MPSHCAFGDFSERIPHYIKEDNKKINLGTAKRLETLKNANKSKTILLICGELSDSIREYAIKAAKLGFEVRIISGQDIDATAHQVDNLIKFKNITYFQAKERPKAHGVLAEPNIYLESSHGHHKPYKDAIFVKNAREDAIKSFRSKFADLEQSSVLVTSG